MSDPQDYAPAGEPIVMHLGIEWREVIIGPSPRELRIEKNIRRAQHAKRRHHRVRYWQRELGYYDSWTVMLDNPENHIIIENYEPD